MSLVSERFGSSGPLPRLEGKEKLTGSDDAKVKGVMFGGRKQFLTDTVGEEGYYAILAKLPPAALTAARTPLASSWYDFASLVQFDRAIYEALRAKYPNVLALMGAASAELGIGRVYKSLDSTKLEYPVYSPIFCASAVGFFLEAILRHGGEQPGVTETTCQTRGDDTCTYELTWR
jgi:hypothetical protein